MEVTRHENLEDFLCKNHVPNEVDLDGYEKKLSDTGIKIAETLRVIPRVHILHT